MPDFKNLNPILINPDQQLPYLPNPSTPIPTSSPTPFVFTTDLSGRDNGDPIFGKGPITDKGLLPTVTANELYENRRYDKFDRNIIDIEDQNAYAQSGFTQATNGILKGVNLAATTVAGSFGMLYGSISAIGTGRMADVWDNPIMQNLDKYNNEVDQNYLPNYYTDKEKNASWYSTDNWWKANFIFDKLIKNAGFAVGAMLSGNIANGALRGVGGAIGAFSTEAALAAESSQAFKLFTPLLRNTARAFSNAKNIETAAVLEGEISSIADLTAMDSQIAGIAKTTNKLAGLQDKFRRTAIALYSSAGEASFEALQTSNEFRNNLIQQYKETHDGQDPTGFDLAKINTTSEEVGKTSFYGNMALLSVTEYAQLPKLMGSSYAAERQAANSLLGKADDVLLRESKYVAAAEGATTKFGKLYERGAKVAKYAFDPKEAGQEIGQYALQVGTQNYFQKGYDGKAASTFTDGFLYGMVGKDKSGKGIGAFNSKEGIESGILGGITGGLMQTFGPNGEIARNKATKSNTEKFLQDLNNAPTFKQAFKEKLEAVNRFVTLQEQQQSATIQGDELEARDLNTDMMHTYLAPRIKYGRYDMIAEDIKDLRQAGMSNNGLSDLKEEGIANVNDTVESFQKRLNAFEVTAKNTEELYKSLNLRYAGAVMKDAEGKVLLSPDGKQIRKYSPLIIDKMVYAASKIADYDLRIPKVSEKLLRTGMPVQDIVDDELSNDTSVSLAKALYNIDEQASDRIDTDIVKQELKDVVELSKRRQLFVNEYNDLKNNPQNYSFTGEKEEFTPEGKKTRTTAPVQSDYFSKSRDKFKSDKRTYKDLVNQYGEGEKNKYEVLQKIAESPYATTLEKQLAAAFLNFTSKNSKIILGDRTLASAGVSRGGTLGPESAVSSINYEDNAYDYEAGSLPVEHVLLHEIGHDLTVYGLSDTNGQFYKELDPLFKLVKETFKNDPDKYAEAGLIKNGEYYAFKNIFEFATEALSNREFQRYLQTIPYEGTKTSTWDAFVNSLKTFFRRLFGTKNETLLDETIAVITNNIDETYKAVKEKNAALEKEEQAMLVTKNEVDRQQDKAELNSGEIATPIPTDTTTSQAIVKEDESYLKSWQDFFISGTSESENAQNRANAPQHVKNSREFLNNLKNFKNAPKIGAMLVTSNNEKALGLEGLTELQFGRPIIADDKVDNVDTGFVAQVFVEHDKNKTYFVDKEGKRLGEVGKPINVNQIIYQAMPTTELYYTYTDPKTGQRVPRYRQGEKENLASAANGWRQERAKLFANNTAAHKVYQINVSRGIPIINKGADGKFERNQVGGILIPEDRIASQPGLIQINTAGFISHKGKNISFKEKGLVVLQYGDTLEILNNSVLGKEKANSLYQVIKALALDIREKSTSGKPLDIDVNYLTYLQNVLYLRKSSTTSPGSNQFFIDTNKRTISIGDVNYPIIDIENREDEIVRQLEGTYHNINSKTVKDVTSKFYEYTGEKNAKGELTARYWKNYQSYLLSGRMPDGRTSRSGANTPLTTIVAAPTPSVPYSFSQKYATLIDFELPIIKPAPVAQAPKAAVAPATPGKIGEYEMNGTTSNTYQFASGPVEFTGTVDADGNIGVDIAVNDTIENAATNPDILATVDSVLQTIGKYDEEASAEQRVVTFVGDKLIAVLKEMQNTQQAEEAPVVEEEAPSAEIEDIKSTRYSGRPANQMVKFFTDKANEDLTEDDVNIIEKVIEKAKEKGWDKNKLSEQLNLMGYSFSSNNSGYAFTNYLEDRLSGKTNIKVTSEFNFYGQLDKELADQQVTSTPVEEVGEIVLDLETAEKRIDIDRRRQEELNKKSTQGTLKNSPLEDITYYENKVKDSEKLSDNALGTMQAMLAKAKDNVNKINAKYDAELAALEGVSNIQRDGNKDIVKGSRIDEIRKIYAGNKSYINIKATNEEVADNLKSGNITAEELFSVRNNFGGELYNWFERGFIGLTGKTYEQYNAGLDALPDGEQILPGEKTDTIDVADTELPEDDYMRVGPTVEEAMTNEELEILKQFQAEKLSGIPLEVLEDLVDTYDGEKAFGVYVDGVAKFYKAGPRTVGYHELFHPVYQHFLSPDERTALEEEFRNRPGQFTDRASGKKIDYARATDKQIEERIADDFAEFKAGQLPARSLSELVRNFFRRIINFVKSFNAKPSLAKDLFKAIDAGKYKAFTISESQKKGPPAYSRIPGITETQASEYAQDIFSRASNYIFGDNKKYLYDLQKISGAEIYNYVKQLYINEKKYEKLGEVRFNALFAQGKQLLRTVGVDFNEEDLVDINDENVTSVGYSQDAFTVDYKKSAPYAIKLVGATLPEVVPTNQQNSTTLELPKRSTSSVKGYKLVNFSRVFSTLLDKFSNTTNVGKIVNNLVDLAKYDATYVRFFQRIGGDLATGTIPFENFKSPEDWRLFINFYQTFTKQKPTALVQYVTGTEVYTAPANQFTITKQVEQDWFSQMRALAKTRSGLVTLNTETTTYQVNTKSELWPDKLPKGPEEMLPFLKNLGITFTMEDYLKLKSEQRTKFSDAVGDIYAYLPQAKDIGTLDGKTLKINKQVAALAALQVKVDNPNQENTMMGVEGNRKQVYTDNNAPSIFENVFNDSETLEELKIARPELNDVFSKNAITFKEGGLFFNDRGNKFKMIKVSYIEGKKSIDSNKGTTTSKLTEGQRFTQEINQNINGNYYILIPADGSTEWMMNLGNHISYKNVVGGRAMDEIHEIFRGYLDDDIALARDWKNRSSLKNIGSKAKELRFFKEILEDYAPTQLEELNIMIDDEATTNDEFKDYIVKNIDAINEAVDKTLKDLANGTKEILLTSSEVVMAKKKNNDAENMYTYAGLDSNFAISEGIDKFRMTETQLDNMLMFVSANDYINSIEFHKILFGDPYQFKIKDGILDQTKRIKSFLSPRGTTFDSPEYNAFLNDQNNVNGIELTPEDYGYHENKEYATTVTLKDVELDTNNYTGVNEADAFSYISDVAYRETKNKNGQWSENAEAWHQYEMALTRKSLSDKGVYKYTNKQLKATDEQILSEEQVEYVIDITKPIVSGSQFNENEIKLVLDKTSQMPLYYSAVAGTNLEKLYIKMFNEKIDYAIMESGRKVGIEKTHSLYNPDGTFNDAPFAGDTKVLVPWSINGKQLETAYEGGTEQTRGSQPTKIVTLDMFDNGEEVVEGAREAFDTYNQALKDLDDNAYTELLSKFGVEDLGVGQFELADPSIIAKTLKGEMFRRELSNNAKDTIQLDENGQQRIPYEASPAYKQIKDIVYSMINKALVSPKMNGGGYTQAAVTGWENAEKGRGIAVKDKNGYREISRKEYEALPADQKNKVVLTSNRLHFPTQEDPYMEVLLPNWMRKSLKGKFKNDADLIRELNKPENQGILRGIAFRIPAQAMSSMAAIRVAGFLPDYMGKTVIVPSEITSQAGSDFDIDKLNMYLKSVYVDENGKLHAVDYKGSEKATKEFYGGVYDNTIRKNIQSISNNNEFRDQLLDVLSAFEQTDTVVSKEQRIFYKLNQDVIDEIISQADAQEMLPSQYMTSQIESLSKKTEKLNSKLLNEEMRDKYVKTMYKKALENRYFDAFEKLLTLPGNFQNLITPIGDAGLKDISTELDDLRGNDETKIKNRIINRNYRTRLRNAFLTGKRWIGIAAVNITGHALAQRMKLVMDINAVATKLTADELSILGDRKIKLPHNEVDGKVSLSGTNTAVANAKGIFEKISNRLSGYATSVVDIAKDPYIMKIIKSDAAIGTFMFLERIGVGQNTVWFMNQPIISEYLNMLESKGTKFLYNPKNVNAIRAKFGLNKLGAKGTENETFNVDSLKANIKTYSDNKNKMLSKQQNDEQGAILKEFLKYAKMAEYSFKFTQATNYDTTKFKNSDTFHRKSTKTDIARDINMFSSVDKLLDSSSLGNQKRLINLGMKAVGAFIKLEQEQFTDITNKVLDSFERQEFMSDDDFSKIASKAKASFLDFVVQTKSGINADILKLTTGNNSIAEQLAKAKLQYPNMKLLQDLVPEASKKIDGAQTIKLKVNLKEAYDENLYVEMMRELRELDPELYNNIVKVAILQGTYQSPVSINNIVPLEDYSKEIKPVIDSLIDDADVEYFANGGMFQKNNWKDEQIVPTTTPRFQFQRDAETKEEIENIIGEDPYGNDVYQYEVEGFETQFDDAENKRLVLTLSPRYDGSNGANSDFVKVSRVFVNNRGQNVDLLSGKTISPQAMKAMRMAGNTSLTDYYGYQKVKYSNGEAVRNFEGRYVYKLVNLLGDGNLVSEYYLDGRPSVLNNGTIKIDKELSDAEIIEYFGGDTAEEVVSLPTEVSDRTTMQMQPQNVAKILNGTKTTTIRESVAKGGNINVGETKIVNFGGKDFNVTNRGQLTIDEAGGVEAMLNSEGLSSVNDFMYQQSKNWANGEGKMYVYDIAPTEEVTETYGSFGTDKEAFDAYRKGFLPGLRELYAKRKEEEKEDGSSWEDLANLLNRQSDLENKKTLTNNESNEIIDIYQKLRDVFGLEIESKEEIQPGQQLDLFEQEDDSWKDEDNNDSCVPF
jgi:hypothetical protein